MSPESFRQTSLIPAHGGYRHLKGFQVAQLAYDVTMRFCDRYIGKRTRTYDQMVQAARSGVQNIAEGSMASATSKKTELKLTNVARASLEELRLDYEDFFISVASALLGRQIATLEKAFLREGGFTELDHQLLERLRVNAGSNRILFVNYMELRPKGRLSSGEYAIIGDSLADMATFRIK